MRPCSLVMSIYCTSRRLGFVFITGKLQLQAETKHTPLFSQFKIQNPRKQKEPNQRYATTTTTTMNHQSTSQQTDNSTSMPLSSWQQCQSRFTAIPRNSLLSDESIPSQVEQHMQLAASSPSSEYALSQMMLSAFLPVPTPPARRMSSSSISSLPQQQEPRVRNTQTNSFLNLPIVPLRRDHSTNGGQCHRGMPL